MRDGSTFPGWGLLLRREEAARYVGLSASTFDGEVKAGRIPRPVNMTPTIKGWHRHDLEAWADSLRAANDATPNPWDTGL